MDDLFHTLGSTGHSSQTRKRAEGDAPIQQGLAFGEALDALIAAEQPAHGVADSGERIAPGDDPLKAAPEGPLTLPTSDTDADLVPSTELVADPDNAGPISPMPSVAEQGVLGMQTVVGKTRTWDLLEQTPQTLPTSEAAPDGPVEDTLGGGVKDMGVPPRTNTAPQTADGAGPSLTATLETSSTVAASEASTNANQRTGLGDDPNARLWPMPPNTPSVSPVAPNAATPYQPHTNPPADLRKTQSGPLTIPPVGQDAPVVDPDNPQLLAPVGPQSSASQALAPPRGDDGPQVILERKATQQPLTLPPADREAQVLVPQTSPTAAPKPSDALPQTSPVASSAAPEPDLAASQLPSIQAARTDTQPSIAHTAAIGQVAEVTAQRSSQPAHAAASDVRLTVDVGPTPSPVTTPLTQTATLPPPSPAPQLGQSSAPSDRQTKDRSQDTPSTRTGAWTIAATAPAPTIMAAPMPSVLTTVTPSFAGTTTVEASLDALPDLDFTLQAASSSLSSTALTPTVSVLGHAPSAMAQTVAHQIAAALSNRATDSDAPMELALDPPELGRVRMQITEIAGVMTLMIQAERPETADLMRRHMDLLAQEFAEAGLDAPSVHVSQDGANGGQHAPPEDASISNTAGPQDLDTPLPLIPHTQATSGGLDLRL